MNDDSLESRVIRANDAKQFLQNPLFREAFEGVAADLEAVALSCDPDNKDKAQRVVIAKQLLAAVKREITRKVEDGEMAQFQMSELERKKGLLKFIR
jgi:hypothetical protein